MKLSRESPTEDLAGIGIFRISKRGGKFLLATSAHTKAGQTKFSNFFPMVKKNFVAKAEGGPMSPLLAG